MRKRPTKAQFEYLLRLGSGARIVVGRTKRETEMYLRRGWTTAEDHGDHYAWIEITPSGMRALADGLADFGLPPIGPRPKIERVVCANCGGTSRGCLKCKSTRYRYEYADVDEPLPAREAA